MKISSEDIKKIAKLASLPISEEEDEKYSEQLSKVIDYFDHLASVNTDRVEPIYDVSSAKNVSREDEIKESLSQGDALGNAPNTKNGFFITKGVFEES